MIYTYKIQHQDVDGNRLLKPNLLENYLLNACGQQADALGIGYHYLLAQNKAWVLVHFSLEMDSIPTVDDVMEVDTWICGFAHMLSPRSWTISLNGKEIGRAHSVWTVMDLNTREMVNVFDQPAFANVPVRPQVELKPSPRVPVLTPDMAMRIAPDSIIQTAQHEVVYSDIDYNGHCNSCKYVEMMLNVCPDVTKEFMGFHINYLKEAYLGEVLIIRWLHTLTGKIFNIINKNNTLLASARF